MVLAMAHSLIHSYTRGRSPLPLVTRADATLTREGSWSPNTHHTLAQLSASCMSICAYLLSTAANPCRHVSRAPNEQPVTSHVGVSCPCCHEP